VAPIINPNSEKDLIDGPASRDLGVKSELILIVTRNGQIPLLLAYTSIIEYLIGFCKAFPKIRLNVKEPQGSYIPLGIFILINLSILI
jgi:hypothetical protein